MRATRPLFTPAARAGTSLKLLHVGPEPLERLIVITR